MSPFTLMNEGSDNEDIYSHSLNVAIMSMMLARSSGMDGQDIKTIAIGALFHDMGKLKVPSAIIRKTTKLTEPEENYLKLHPKYSVDLADLSDSFPKQAKPILSQHHELLDGSGYPKQLTAEIKSIPKPSWLQSSMPTTTSATLRIQPRPRSPTAPSPTCSNTRKSNTTMISLHF